MKREIATVRAKPKVPTRKQLICEIEELRKQNAELKGQSATHPQRSRVLHAPPQLGDPDDLSQTAWACFNNPDPKERFAALQIALRASAARGSSHGAPAEETSLLLNLNFLLDEISDGNYANAMLPKTSGPGKRTSFDQKRLEAWLKHLVLLRREISGRQFKLIDAASYVAREIDERLKPYGVDLQAALPKYKMSGRRTSPAAGRAHRLGTRLVNYAENSCFDNGSVAGTDEKLLQDFQSSAEGDLQKQKDLYEAFLGITVSRILHSLPMQSE